MSLKLFEDLKYVGTNEKINIYGDSTWHCTSYVTRLETGKMEYVVQPPHYHEGKFMGYTNLSAYVITEDELCKNFKIVNEDGTLTDIVHSKKDKKLQKEFKSIKDYFDNMSAEELEGIIKKG